MNIFRSLLLAVAFTALAGTAIQPAAAQDTRRMYGDTARTSAVKYVGTLTEAQALSRKTGKPIFFNCYAAWVAPCVAMDQYVFSNPRFAAWLEKNFVCLLVNMSSPEGKTLARRYGVDTYAYYLVLDADGNVVHRLQGGAKLPEFRDNVARALSRKTSLAGTEARYASGKYSREDLYNYLRALRIAGRDSLFIALGKKYITTMQPADMAKEGNWMFVGLFRDRNSDFYRYYLTHKADFLKHNELLRVNNKFESFLTPKLLQYASGDMAYDAADVAAYRRDIKTFGMPDTCATAVLCDIADLRGRGNFDALMDYMDHSGHYLDKYYSVRSNIELTFRFPGLTAAQKQRLKDYLTAAIERENGSRGADRLRTLRDQLDNEGKGITFMEGKLSDALARAKAEGKGVFLDCFTTWCGPCRMMSSTIFPQSAVGEYFNAHFVSIKIDMERGEGPELAKKYAVKAYPTMLFLDATGKVVHTVVGARPADRLIDEARQAVGK